MKKICLKCKKSKDIEKFGNQAASSDGKNPYCKNCMHIMDIECKEKRYNPVYEDKSVAFCRGISQEELEKQSRAVELKAWRERKKGKKPEHVKRKKHIFNRYQYPITA